MLSPTHLYGVWTVEVWTVEEFERTEVVVVERGRRLQDLAQTGRFGTAQRRVLATRPKMHVSSHN